MRFLRVSFFGISNPFQLAHMDQLLESYPSNITTFDYPPPTKKKHAIYIFQKEAGSSSKPSSLRGELLNFRGVPSSSHRSKAKTEPMTSLLRRSMLAVTRHHRARPLCGVLLMAEIQRSPVEVGGLSHLQDFIHPRWCRIFPSTVCLFQGGWVV